MNVGDSWVDGNYEITLFAVDQVTGAATIAIRDTVNGTTDNPFPTGCQSTDTTDGDECTCEGGLSPTYATVVDEPVDPPTMSDCEGDISSSSTTSPFVEILSFASSPVSSNVTTDVITDNDNDNGNTNSTTPVGNATRV